MVSQWKDMVGTAFSLAIVGYVINLAMGRTLANKHGYDVDSNQVPPAAPGRAQGCGPHRILLMTAKEAGGMAQWSLPSI